MAHVQGVTQQGRDKHLSNLIAIFRERNRGWSSFGCFLKALFAEVCEEPQYKVTDVTLPLKETKCRHHPGGKHYVELRSPRARGPSCSKILDHERYLHVCASAGVFDIGKNPGLVVTELCNAARRFLDMTGQLRMEHELRGRDFLYNQPSASPSSAMTSFQSPGPSSLNALSSPHFGTANAEVDPTGKQPSSDDGKMEIQSEIGDTISGNSFTTSGGPAPDDMETEFIQLLESSPVEGSYLSEDSFGVGVGRLSTKLRVATLAYLRNFADQPGRLEEQFNRLRDDSSLQVLHLCGCGMCLQQSGDQARSHGCARPSHLKLGSAVENGLHKTYHTFLNVTPDWSYLDSLSIIHEGRFGAGIF